MDSRSLCIAAALLLAGTTAPVSAEVRSRPTRDSAAPRATLDGVPVSFEANAGQVDPEVRFLARARGFRAFLLDAGAVFALPGGGAVRMEFEGVRAGAAARGARPLAARSHYLLGNDPSAWVRDVPHVAEVEIADLYPGATLRWRPAAGRLLEYDLLLAPGADPGVVAMRFEGAESVEVDARGDLLVGTPGGLLRHGRPVAWQDADGRRVPVAAEFALLGGNRAGFRVGRHDPARPLVIDPVVQYGSYHGGTSTEDAKAVAADANRAAYIFGQTTSANYPVKSAYQGNYQGGNLDFFLAKVAPDGASLVYATYLGGSGDDAAVAVAVDAGGSAHVTGYTTSDNYPVASAVQGTLPAAGVQSGVVTRLAASGSSLAWSTYLGGDLATYPYAIALDPAGAAVVVGGTLATNLPMASSSPIQGSRAGGYDGFVVRFATAGNAISWATYLGGSGTDEIKDVVADSTGIYVAGVTLSANFPLVSPYQGTLKGSRDAVVAKIAPGGTSLLYSTLLGGTGMEQGNSLEVDAQGAVWVAGSTTSTDLPLVSAAQGTAGGGSDGCVAKVTATGNALLRSTYLGGDGDDSLTSLGLAPGGGVWVGGLTTSTNLAVVDAISATLKGSYDGVLAHLPATGTGFLTLTYVGGNDLEFLLGLAVDEGGSVLVVGSTNSTDFPANGTFQPAKADGGGGLDAFILRLQSTLHPPSDLEAVLTGLTKVLVTWIDYNGDESGFVLERSVSGGPFTERATLPPDTVQFQETGLAPATEYAWRVRTFRGLEASGTSNTDSLITPGTPVTAPAAPTDLEVDVVSPREVALTWVDASDNEDFFIVARAVGPSLYATLATPVLGATSYTDATVLPGRAYSWKVIAYNPIGNSLDSNIVTLTMPSTLEVSVLQGRIADSAKLAGDSVIVKGTLAFGGEAESAAFDSALLSISLRLGDHGKPPLMDVAAGDEGWTVRRGVHTWRSPKGSLVKAKLVVRPETGEFAAKLTHLTLVPAPASPVRVTVGVGTDSGFGEDSWVPGKRAGQLRFP